jgi:hypothetical protein
MLCGLLGGPPIEQGHSAEGWLHFVDRTCTAYLLAEGTPMNIKLQIFDIHGKEHTIKECLTGGSHQRAKITFEIHSKTSGSGGLH